AAPAAEAGGGTLIATAVRGWRLRGTVGGHSIDSLLTERMRLLIENEGLTLPLKASEPIVLGRDYVAATEANAGKAVYNPDTRLVEGWIAGMPLDRKSTRLNSSHVKISYAVFCLKKKKTYFS